MGCKNMDKKGFTLAELLIVVAIIVVLVAIAIPIFSGQLEKAREAADAANIRSEYAKLMNDVVLDEYKNKEYKVALAQQRDGWQNSFDFPCDENGSPKKGGSAILEYKNNKAYINYGVASIVDKAATFVVSGDKQATAQGTLYKYGDNYYIATKEGHLEKGEEPKDNSKGLYKVNINTVYSIGDINSQEQLDTLKNVKKGDVILEISTNKYYVYYGTNQKLKVGNDLQVIN